MKRIKVLYFLNHAPNYRDIFLSELGKYIDLTAVFYPGAEAKLKDPDKRENYQYIIPKTKRFLNIHFNLKEFTLANGDYDVIIVGYSLWYPFRMLNLFRRNPNKRIISTGIFFGRNQDALTKILRKLLVERSEGILAYSDIVKNKLLKEGVTKPIISFNNTSFKESDIEPLPIPALADKLNILWVGRFLPRKRVERLYELAKIEPRINVRIIGPGNREFFKGYPGLSNFELFDAAYGNDLKGHFQWSHLVFNPGGAGLLVMNAARFQRAIVIDNNSHHGPEIQLAINADQDFIDFSDREVVLGFIDYIFNNPSYLQEKAEIICEEMHNFTIEHMVAQYLKAINGEWK